MTFEVLTVMRIMMFWVLTLKAEDGDSRVLRDV
jgi:hypothetical protein